MQSSLLGPLLAAPFLALSLAPATSAQIVRERFAFNDVSDPFERTLGERDRFGSAMAGLGDLNGDGLKELAIGAEGDHREEGAVWIFSMRPTRQIAAFVKLGPIELLPFRLDSGDRFGSAMVALGDLDGNGIVDLAVGAGGDGGSAGFLAGPGAAYLLFLDPSGAIRDFEKFGSDSGSFQGLLDLGDAFGEALASPGDLDGNGVPDLIVGAPGDDAGGEDTGAAWVLFLDPAHHVQDLRKLTTLANGLEGELTPRERFGVALAALGDLDGDGISELAVGSDSPQKLRVLFLDSQGRVRRHVRVALDNVGRAVVALGDVDGDGVEDLAANTRILLLNADGTLKSASAPLPAPPYPGFGSALAAPGDTNGDGRPDLIIGSPGADVRVPSSGAISFFEIDSNGLVSAPRRDVDAASSGLPIAPRGLGSSSDRYGQSSAAVGDLNEDGLVEIAMGAPRDDDLGLDAGALWIHFLQGGSGRRVEKISAVRDGLPLHAGDQFAADLAALGDLDGDGVEDLVASAPLADEGGTDTGAAYVLFLARNGRVLRHQKISRLEGGFVAPPGMLRFGQQVERLGDLDGDGHGELAVSSQESGGRDSVWVLFLNPDGTVRAQTQLDRARVVGLGTGPFGVTLTTLDGAAGHHRYLAATGTTVPGNSPSIWRLELGSDGQIQDSVRLPFMAVSGLVAGLGDLDGDGVADLISVNSTNGVTLTFLGADFTIRSQRLLAFSSSIFRGQGLSALGDLLGDGVPDLAFCGASPSHEVGLLLSLDGQVRWGFEHRDNVEAEPLENGRQFPVPHLGRTFAVSSSGANLGATVFDSSPSGPNAGDDLCVDSGNVLILQDSLAPTQSAPTIFDDPRDDPDGGLLAFDFPRRIRALSIDLADLDPYPMEGATVTLIDRLGRTRLYDVPAGWTGPFGASHIRTLALDTLADQPGAGPYPALAYELPGFDPGQVVRVEVELFDGGALDNLRYDPYP